MGQGTETLSASSLSTQTHFITKLFHILQPRDICMQGSADKCTFISINTANQCQAIKAGSGGILVTFPGVRKPIKRQKNESSMFVCPCVPVSSQRSLWPGVMALTSSHTAECCVHVWFHVPVILTPRWFFFVSTLRLILATGTQLYYFEDNALRALVFCVSDYVFVWG